MPNLGDITVRVTAEDLASAKLQNVGREIDATAKKAGSAKQGFLDFGAGMLGMGATLSAGVTAPLTLIGKTALDAASNLNEAMTAVSTVFGAAADDVLAFADTSAVSLGITEEAALSASSRLGALAKGLGFTDQAAADFSTEIIEAATDLSSFYNVPGADALAALRSGLVGETEPLRQFGILLNEAAVQEEGVRLGLIELGGEMTEQEKVIARQSLIMGQLGDAQGDFAKTSDGLANSQRILQAEFGNLAAELGGVLLPIALQAVSALLDFVPTISGLISGFQTLDPGVQTAILGFAGLLAAAGPVALAIGGVITVVGALLSPIGLLVLASAGLFALYQTNAGFADAVNAAFGVLQGILTTLAGFVTGTVVPAFQNLISLAGDVATAFGEGGLGAALAVLGDAFATAFGNLSTIVAEKLQEVSSALLTWFQEQATAATTGAQGVLTAVQTAWAGLGVMASEAWNAVTTAVQTAWEAIRGAVETRLIEIATAVSTKWAEIQSAIDTVLAALQTNVGNAWIEIQNAVISHVDTIRLEVIAKWEEIQAFLGEKLAAIQSAISTAWETISSTVSTVTETIRSTIETAWTTTQETVTTILGTIQETIGTTWETIQSTVTTAVDNLKTLVSDGFQAMVDAITTAKEDAIAALANLKDEALALFADAGTWLLRAGKDLIQGFIDGVLSMGGAVSDAVASVLPDIGDPAGDARRDVGPGDPNRPAGSRQHGGPVSAFHPYLVGERGPEWFVPGVSGTVLPHGASPGGQTIHIGTLNLPNVRDSEDFVRWLRDVGSGERVALGRG